jgi:UDP-glucose 4-epimerase
MNILLTGAAGYIGSIVAEELSKEGNFVVAMDNLQQGHREAVIPEAEFVQVDLANPGELDNVFYSYRIEAVMHLAAESRVEYSMTDPRRFFQNNVIGGINLLDTMLKHSVYRLIFSSTAAVYGIPEKVPIEEDDTRRPVNPYGESKLMFERVLHWYGYVYELRFVCLRYFNAGGASERFGEAHNPETHLIPNVLKVALGQVEHVPIFGTDYPTKDGSCVRDYIHVLDIARAHVLCLNYLETNQVNKAYNLGNGAGYSVLEVIETAKDITGAKIPVVTHPRRSGDPTVLVASSKLAQCELGWEPEFPKLESIIADAWRWQKKHPNGYE